MSMMNEGMYSSQLQDWGTPQSFVDLVEAQLGVNFTLDVCAYPENAKCETYFTEADDGLKQQWDGYCWKNPPYGKKLPVWLEYAYNQSINNPNCKLVVCLVPARTDTKRFHEIAMKGMVVLLKGRIPFEQQGNTKGSPAFPSMLVLFYKDVDAGDITTWDWKENE